MSTPKNWKEGTNALEHNLKVLAGRMKGQQMTPDPVGSLAEEWLALRSKGRKPSLPVFRGIPTWRQDIYTLVTTPVKKSTEGRFIFILWTRDVAYGSILTSLWLPVRNAPVHCSYCCS